MADRWKPLQNCYRVWLPVPGQPDVHEVRDTVDAIDPNTLPDGAVIQHFDEHGTSRYRRHPGAVVVMRENAGEDSLGAPLARFEEPGR